MKFDLIVFDFDGTLANTFPFFVSIINTLALKHGFKTVGSSDVQILRNMNALDILQYLGLSRWKLPKVLIDFHSKVKEQTEHIHIIPNIDFTISLLRQNVEHIAIVSSNSRENVCRILGENILSQICTMKCGTSLFGKKHKLKQILSATKTKPCNAIYIGDEVRDIEAGKSVKMKTGCVSWGYNTVECLKSYKPDFIFSTVEDICTQLG